MSEKRKSGTLLTKIKDLFTRREPEEALTQEAVAFVDYEYWYISMRNGYHVVPDIQSWCREIRREFGAGDIWFFANFAQGAFQREIPRIRKETNGIVETQCRDDNRPMKDMSDVITLDAIYRKAAEEKSPHTFILFTGDGHFQPVIRYLIQEKHKRVIIYAVKHSLSRLLMDSGAEIKEIPAVENQRELCYSLIVNEFDRLFRKYGEVVCTFKSLTLRLSEIHGIPQQTFDIALSEMIEAGLVLSKRRHIAAWRQTNGSRIINNLVPQWDKLIEAGYYTPEE